MSLVLPESGAPPLACPFGSPHSPKRRIKGHNILSASDESVEAVPGGSTTINTSTTTATTASLDNAKNEPSLAPPSADNLTEAHLQIGPGQELCYWTLGERNNADGSPRPALILLHGLRDVGRGLLHIADAVKDQFFCVMPDLRGHGKSVQPGAYAIQHYLMDLRRLQQALKLTRVSLLGHSLGGHIVCRYAGLFPAEIESLIVVEGLGPPRWEMPKANEMDRIAAQLQRAIATAEYASNPRDLPSVEEAANRLRKSNPRLTSAWAMQLAEWGTIPAETNNTSKTPPNPVRWAFDPRAQEVFLGVSDTVNFDYWRAITAPTLIVMGSLGHEYWGSRFAADDYTGHFLPGELEERLNAIGNTRHVEIPQAGHQVHYDQPHQLAAVARNFLVEDTLLKRP